MHRMTESWPASSQAWNVLLNNENKFCWTTISKKRKKTNQQNSTNFLKFDIKMTIDNSTEIDQPKSGNILSSNEQSIYCG